MKLNSYMMRSAVEAGNYALVGEIMAEHFSAPVLAAYALKFSPEINKLSSSEIFKYAVFMSCKGLRYSWKDTDGFNGPTDVGRYEYEYFDIWRPHET